MIGWPPSEFWAASMYELTTALLAHRRMHTAPEPEPMDDDAIWAMLDAHDAMVGKPKH